MEFSLAKIKQITDDAALKGVPVKVKDIAFYILREAFGDSLVAYRACIDQMADQSIVSTYENGYVQNFVRQWASQYIKVNYDELASELSFEENKGALIKMLDDIKGLELTGDIEHKDAIKMAADIRVKLNDKFSVQDDEKGQIVVVPPKFNGVCPRFHVECYEQTKEWAMSNFHLIPDPSYMDENGRNTSK